MEAVGRRREAMARVAALTVLGVVAAAWPELAGALGLMLSGAAVVGRGKA